MASRMSLDQFKSFVREVRREWKVKQLARLRRESERRMRNRYRQFMGREILLSDRSRLLP